MVSSSGRYYSRATIFSLVMTSDNTNECAVLKLRLAITFNSCYTSCTVSQKENAIKTAGDKPHFPRYAYAIWPPGPLANSSSLERRGALQHTLGRHFVYQAKFRYL